jgi:hypothetical protein
MKTFRRALSVTAVSLMLLGIPAGMPAQGQEEETGLLGYTVGATASAISTVYNQPSFGIPADPTFEVRKIYSISQLDTGPSGRAMGSVAWIGDVAGNAPPSLIFDSFLFNPTQIEELNEPISELKFNLGEGFKTAPPYPVRAESFYPPGGTKSEEVGAGIGMRARASEKTMEASSTSGRAGIPTVVSFGTLESSSFSTVDNDIALSIAKSRVTDLDILGFVHIDQILTLARATSDGVKASTESMLQISGMTIKDQTGKEQAKIVVDQTGFHAGDAEQDPFGVLAEQIFDKYLKPNGINLTFGGSLGMVDGAVGSMGVQGIILSLNSAGMNTLLDAMPAEVSSALKNPSGAPGLGSLFSDGGVLSPTLAGFLATFFQGDQTMQFIFGSASANSAASPPFVLPDLPEFGGEVPPLLPGGVSPPIDFGTGDPGTITQPGNGGGGTILAARPVGVLGVPASLIGLMLLAGLLGSRYLRILADRMTAAKVVARCSLEESP